MAMKEHYLGQCADLKVSDAKTLLTVVVQRTYHQRNGSRD
jgi:hypothetical protein